jgi:hypothetical protein
LGSPSGDAAAIAGTHVSVVSGGDLELDALDFTGTDPAERREEEATRAVREGASLLRPPPPELKHGETGGESTGESSPEMSSDEESKESLTLGHRSGEEIKQPASL